MSELKIFKQRDVLWGRWFIEYYLKSEVDKVIAELKAQKAQAEDDCAYWKMREGNTVNAMHETEEACMCLTKSERHQKYKRCLANSQEWRNYAVFCGMQSSCHNHRGFGKTAGKWSWKETHAWKCVNRWLKHSEKFKEAS